MTTPTPTGQAPAPSNPDPTAPTGQAPANPAPAGNPAPWERDGTPFDPARAWSLIEKLRSDLAARAGAPATPPAPAAPAAPPAAPAPSGDLAGQIETLRLQVARERSARRHGLDDDLIELLGTGTDEQIEARAKTLAERIGAAASTPAAPVPRRPVENLRGGGDPSAPPEETDPLKLAELVRQRSPF